MLVRKSNLTTRFILKREGYEKRKASFHRVYSLLTVTLWGIKKYVMNFPFRWEKIRIRSKMRVRSYLWLPKKPANDVDSKGGEGLGCRCWRSPFVSFKLSNFQPQTHFWDPSSTTTQTLSIKLEKVDNQTALLSFLMFIRNPHFRKRKGDVLFETFI